MQVRLDFDTLIWVVALLNIHPESEVLWRKIKAAEGKWYGIYFPSCLKAKVIITELEYDFLVNLLKEWIQSTWATNQSKLYSRHALTQFVKQRKGGTMSIYKVDLTEKELKNLARDKVTRGQYWRYSFYFFVPLLVPMILSIFFRDWLKALTEPIQLVFFGAMFVPWLIVVVLLNQSINRRTLACLTELKKQGR